MENDQLLQALSDMMDQKLQPINNRLDNMDNRLDNMDNRLNSMENRLNSMDNRLDGMGNRLEELESQVSALRSIQLEMHKKLSETHQLALDAWGTSFENRTWLENPKKFG